MIVITGMGHNRRRRCDLCVDEILEFCVKVHAAAEKGVRYLCLSVGSVLSDPFTSRCLARRLLECPWSLHKNERRGRAERCDLVFREGRLSRQWIESRRFVGPRLLPRAVPLMRRGPRRHTGLMTHASENALKMESDRRTALHRKERTCSLETTMTR